MTQYTWKKWKILSVKTVNPYVKKNEKKLVVLYKKRDNFAVLSSQWYNFNQESNPYITALGNFDPAERPEIKIFDVQNRRIYLWVY